MDETGEFLLLFFIISSVALCFVMIPTVLTLRSSKKSRLQQSAKPEKLKLSVTVTDMHCGVKMVGIKTPQTAIEQPLSFQAKRGIRFPLYADSSTPLRSE